jgi:hypothetical protein
MDVNGAVVMLAGGITAVFTSSNNGNINAKCGADVASPASGAAVQFDFASTGVRCIIEAMGGVTITKDWHETVSASGKATIICKVMEN